MSLTPQLCSELIRQRMAWEDDSQAARVINLIPQTLKAFARRYAADAFTRQLVTTDKTTTTLTLSNGQANLVTGYDTYQFLMEYFDLGQLYFLPSAVVSPYVTGAGSYASGTWTFNANPAPDETIVVNGVTFTFIYQSVIVAGAGTASINGTYTNRNTIIAGRPLYNLTGEATDYQYYSIYWNGTSWNITDSLGFTLYYSLDDVAFPWLATTWEIQDSDLPVPTVTASSLTSVQIGVSDTPTNTATAFATVLNASANSSINVATYEASFNTVNGIYDTVGTGGNSFTMANSSGGAVTRSAATFTGGAATSYGLFINSMLTSFADGDVVQFTTTGSLPTGLSLATNYYIVDYTAMTGSATFGVATSPTARPIAITSTGSGVHTIAKQFSLSIEPLQALPNAMVASLPRYLDNVFNYYYVQGQKLIMLPIEDETPTGTIACAVPYYPTTVALLPDSEEAEREFLQLLYETVSSTKEV